MRLEEGGFTFVEVLVVTFLLAAGIVGFLQSALLADRLRERSRLLAASVLHAEAALERIGAIGWGRSTGALPRESHPELLDAPAPLPARLLAQEGASFLLLHERIEDGAGPPRVSVRCFWAAGAASFRRRDVVVFTTRAP